MNTFSSRLRYAMNSAQMHQADLARESGVPKSSISMYLSGQHEPTYAVLVRLADATRVPIDFLRFGELPPDLPEPVQQMTRKVSVKAAARCMQKSEQFVRIGLQRGLLPIGTAVPGVGGHWSYYISPYRLRIFVGPDIFDRCFAPQAEGG